MNKRAEWTLLQTGTILAGILVAFVLVMIVYRTTSQAGAEATFLAKDSAMLTDAILSTPGDVQLVYPREFNRWYARINNTSISIFRSEPEPNKESPYKHFFVPRGDIKIEENELALSAIFFIKTNDTYTISNIPVQEEQEEVEPGD